MPDFDNLFQGISKKIAKDKDVAMHKPGDITLNSLIPYGIPTGIPELDLSLYRPGYPAGRVVEFYGFEASGKTTAALHALAQAQAMGGGGMYIDTEFTWDDTRAIELGVDPDKNFRLAEANTIEGVFRQIEATLRQIIKTNFKAPFIIVVDSVTGVETEFNREDDFGKEARVGQDARVIRHGMRRMGPLIAKSKALPIFINHAVSTIAKTPFAKQSQAAGGHAIKLFASLRVNFKAGSAITRQKEGKKVRKGMNVYLEIEKLKSSRLEYPKIEIPLLNSGGFDQKDSLLKAMVNTGLVEEEDKTYSLLLEEPMEFPEEDWETVIDGLGGFNKVYKMFLDWCLENERIKKWGTV